MPSRGEIPVNFVVSGTLSCASCGVETARRSFAQHRCPTCAAIVRLELKRADGRRYYARNRPKFYAAAKLHRKRHPEVRRRDRARWREAHRDLYINNKRATDARRRGATGRHTAAEWAEVVRGFKGRCAYCGTAGRLERDHVIPLRRGGTNDISNIVPACPSCNRRKAGRTDVEFRAAEDLERMAKGERSGVVG